jgi:hypothetical protein
MEVFSNIVGLPLTEQEIVEVNEAILKRKIKAFMALNLGPTEEEGRRLAQMQFDAAGWKEILQYYWPIVCPSSDTGFLPMTRIHARCVTRAITSLW